MPNKLIEIVANCPNCKQDKQTFRYRMRTINGYLIYKCETCNYELRRKEEKETKND